MLSRADCSCWPTAPVIYAFSPFPIGRAGFADASFTCRDQEEREFVGEEWIECVEVEQRGYSSLKVRNSRFLFSFYRFPNVCALGNACYFGIGGTDIHMLADFSFYHNLRV